MNQQSKPIRVAAVGMDERMRNALRLFFKGPCKNLCILVEEDSAETGILDMDGYHEQDLLAEYRERHPNQPVILLSLHEINAENGVYVKKPLKPDQLISALTKAKQEIRLQSRQREPDTEAKPTDSAQPKIQTQEIEHPPNKTEEQTKRVRKRATAPTTHHAANYLEEQSAKVLIGTAPDIHPEDPQQLAKAEYNPDDFLQNHLFRACETADDRNRCVRMDTPRGLIDIFPGGQNVSLKCSDSQLRTLSVVPLIDNSFSVSTLEAGHRLQQDDDSSIANRDALLWKTALWAARGRIPAGTSLHTPVFLSRWPNMTRLLLFPHALRIAALWANQPHSLLATATTLNIPQRYVFGFYSGAHALGLASTGRRTVDTLIEPAPLQKNRQLGLFGRILNHLRKK
ncbi:MAG: hypothetical protein ABFS39_02075 [Pseudomonadota bacterium]